MFTVLWTLLVGSPVRLAIWIGNRVATWTGLFFLWRRLNGSPNRWRRFLVVGSLVNLASLVAVVGLLWALARSRWGR